MRYNYWIHLRGPQQFPFSTSSFNVSKTRLHKVIDFYSKCYYIEQIVIQPCNIQNPPPEAKKEK